MEAADVAVIAVPPSAVAATLAAAQARGLAGCYTDVASVKQLPVAQARAPGCDLTSYVPGHPLAGREKHGPAAARADLFLGRTWALCPAPETSEAAVAAITTLVRTCGAVPVRTDAATHDRWVALVSHAPHLVASAMAARLEGAPAEALGLAGQGLRDVTRIAAGDTGLWTQILAANAEPVAEVLFNEFDIDGYFLEYDSSRAGDFSPLRFVPKGKTVVLGLVTTKKGALENKNDIKRRIEEAAKFVPVEQLALSPQCGFASNAEGNALTVDQEKAKLQLIVEIATEVWGRV